MAQSTTNAASSYLHDHSPDISISRKLADSGGGRDIDCQYVPGHLPPVSKKYKVTSSTRAGREHVTDLYGIEAGNDNPISSRLTHPSKVVPTTAGASLSGSTSRKDPSDILTHNDSMMSSSKTVRVCSPDGSKFNQDTQHSIEDGRSTNDKASSGVLGTVEGAQNGDKTTTDVSQWKKLHRIVEQMDDEPCCIILFKWLLIIVGLGMLIAVIEIMGEVMYEWFSGDLDKSVKISKPPPNETFSLDKIAMAIKNKINETIKTETSTETIKTDE
jgi:hypothetical protein